MKKIAIPIIVALLVGVVAAYFLLPSRLPNHVHPAEPNSFGAVTAHLDSGGELYVYFSTERIIKAFDQFSAKISERFSGSDAESQAAAFFLKLMTDSGMKEISGVGVSSVTVTPEYSRLRMFVHHASDRNRGLIWQIGSDRPRELEELRLLPAATVLAAFDEIRLDKFWQWLKQEVAASNLGPMKEGISAIEPMLKVQGIDLEAVLRSLNGPMGYLITLDPKRQVSIPRQALPPLTIPEPGLAIVMKVNDLILFNLLKSKLPMAKFVDNGELKKLSFGGLSAPFPLEPTIVAAEGWLFFASNPRLIEAMLAAKAKGDGLVAGAEYAEMATGLPRQGNGFTYLGARFWELILNIQKESQAEAGNTPEQRAVLRLLSDLFPRGAKFYGVVERLPNGIGFTANHNLRLEKLLLLPFEVAAEMKPRFATAPPPESPGQQQTTQPREASDLSTGRQ